MHKKGIVCLLYMKEGFEKLNVSAGFLELSEEWRVLQA